MENINGKLFLYYSKYKSKSKVVYHCVMEINVENPSKSVEVVLTKEKYKKKKSKTIFLKSKDLTKFAFVSDPYGKKKDKDKINVSTFLASDNSSLWSKSYSKGILRKQIEFDNIHLANNGNLILALKDYVKDTGKASIKNKKGKKVPGYTQVIVALSENETQSLDINSDNDYLVKCDINSDNSRLIICGTYRVKNKGNIAGVYSTVVDLSTFEASISKKTKFTKSVLAQLDEEDVANNKDKDPGIELDTGLGTIINEDDGQIKYIYEPYERKVNTSSSGGVGTGVSISRNRTTIYYIASSIVVVDINDDIKFTTIPRHVKFSFNFQAIKTKAVESNNELYLLYLDHRDNVDPKKRKKTKKGQYKLKRLNKPKDGVLVAAKFTDENTIVRKVLKDLDKENFYFNPSFMTKVSDRKFLLTGINDGFFSSRKQKNLLLDI